MVKLEDLIFLTGGGSSHPPFGRTEPKVKEAKVTRLEVKPHHNFAWTGWDNCNIKSFEVDITFIWDGIIHKNGQTVLRIAMVPGATEAEEVKVIRTDAAINLGNEAEWQKLGKDIQSLFSVTSDK